MNQTNFYEHGENDLEPEVFPGRFVPSRLKHHRLWNPEDIAGNCIYCLFFVIGDSEEPCPGFTEDSVPKSGGDVVAVF